MDKKMLVDEVNNKKITQFQVVQMSNPGLDKKKAFKYQVGKT